MILDLISTNWIVQAVFLVVLAATCGALIVKRSRENSKKTDHLHEIAVHPLRMEAQNMQNTVSLEKDKLEVQKWQFQHRKAIDHKS